jgi:hypothetical protein
VPKNQVRIESMAATATTANPTTANLGADAPAPLDIMRSNSLRRRRISPRAGRALEILGHAIDYLVDENVHRADSRSMEIGQMEAVQLLMKINRQIYFECPEVPSMSERRRSLLGLRIA